MRASRRPRRRLTAVTVGAAIEFRRPTVGAADHHLIVLTEIIHAAVRARRIHTVGGVIIGDVPSWRADNMPYGGVKASGLGREGVRFAIEEMTEIRLMALRSP